MHKRSFMHINIMVARMAIPQLRVCSFFLTYYYTSSWFFRGCRVELFGLRRTKSRYIIIGSWPCYGVNVAQTSQGVFELHVCSSFHSSWSFSAYNADSGRVNSWIAANCGFAVDSRPLAELSIICHTSRSVVTVEFGSVHTSYVNVT